MAAVLAGGEGAVLSHRSAAALWGVASLGSGALEITSPRSTRSQPGIERHYGRVRDDERTVCDGIPVTTVPRTLLDFAAVVSRDRFERALREAEVRRLYDSLSLEDLLDRHPGRRGNKIVRAGLERLRHEPAGLTREELEHRFSVFLDRFHLPRPRFNAWLQIGERWIQVDCLWRSNGLIAELDGNAVHGTRHAFESDRERDRRLQAEGWRVVRITWRQLRDDKEAIADDLRRMLSAANYKRS